MGFLGEGPLQIQTSCLRIWSLSFGGGLEGWLESYRSPPKALRFCQGMGWGEQMERLGRYWRNPKPEEEEEGGGATSTSRCISPLILHLCSLGGLERGWEGGKGSPPSVMPVADVCDPCRVPPFLALVIRGECGAPGLPFLSSSFGLSCSPISRHSSFLGPISSQTSCLCTQTPPLQPCISHSSYSRYPFSMSAVSSSALPPPIWPLLSQATLFSAIRVCHLALYPWLIFHNSFRSLFSTFSLSAFLFPVLPSPPAFLDCI